MVVTLSKLKFGLQNQRSGVVAFQCDVHIDGKRVATAEEEGRGGCLSIHPVEPFAENRAIIAKAQEHFATLPSKYGSDVGNSDLDEEIIKLVSNVELQKDIERLQKKGIVWTSADDKDNLMCFGYKKPTLADMLKDGMDDKIKELIAKLKAQNPGCKIYNTNLSKFL